MRLLVRASSFPTDWSALLLNLLPGRAVADDDLDVLNFGTSGRVFHLDRHIIDTGEIRLRFVERDKARHLERQALLVIGALTLPRLMLSVPLAGGASSRMAGRVPLVQSGSTLR